MYSDPTGHSITAAIIIGVIVGITIAFAATAYTDYVDDGEVFNGSVDAVDYVANMVVGGAVGGFVGYASPAIGTFLTTNFTFGAPALVAGGEAIAVTVSGAQIVGGVAATSLLFSYFIGENGTQIISESTWYGKGKERIDVENPAPGKRDGQIHYHEPNDQRHLFDISTRNFPNPTKRLKGLLTDKNFIKGLKKALRYLGE